MLIRLASLSLSFHKEVLPCIALNSVTFKRFKKHLIMADPWPVLEKRKAEDEATDCQSDIKKPRGRRKMHALLLAYCGQGYLGLQRNFGLKTIEEDIMVALKKLDILNEEEFLKQQLVHFQRAARTDKGVSALRQVINLNMRDGVKAEDINQHLPEQIRVLAVKRVTKGFNSKNSCDYRSYSYTCPSFAFAPKSVKVSEDYRISEEVVENLNKWASCYVGTHNYHNFTSGRKPLDPSCKRHIMSVVCEQPVLREDLELVTFLVKGQSFMLHQIRKMIGVLMAIARGYVSSEYITKAFLVNELLQLPVAPGLGLLLEQVHYDWYNTKYGDNGIHEKLDFQDVEHLVSEFREKQIYPIIIKEEKENKSMLTYMETLDAHYEEYHNETSDIFSKVLPDDFVPTNENEAEVKAKGLEIEENKSDDTADIAEKEAATDTNHDKYHNETSNIPSEGLSVNPMPKNGTGVEVKAEGLESEKKDQFNDAVKSTDKPAEDVGATN